VSGCTCEHYGYDSSACDNDYAAVWRTERIESTRKKHKCSECGSTIEAGSRCCKATSLTRGDGWYVWYRCLNCAALAEVMADKYKTCPLWGGLFEFCDNYGEAETWVRFIKSPSVQADGAEQGDNRGSDAP